MPHLVVGGHIYFIYLVLFHTIYLLLFTSPLSLPLAVRARRTARPSSRSSRVTRTHGPHSGRTATRTTRRATTPTGHPTVRVQVRGYQTLVFLGALCLFFYHKVAESGQRLRPLFSIRNFYGGRTKEWSGF